MTIDQVEEKEPDEGEKRVRRDDEKLPQLPWTPISPEDHTPEMPERPGAIIEKPASTPKEEAALSEAVYQSPEDQLSGGEWESPAGRGKSQSQDYEKQLHSFRSKLMATIGSEGSVKAYNIADLTKQFE